MVSKSFGGFYWLKGQFFKPKIGPKQNGLDGVLASEDRAGSVAAQIVP